MRGLSLVAASGGHSSSRCAGLSLSRPLLLRGTGSRHAGSVVVAHGPSCSAACGIFPDQGSNPCPLHWQAGSQPLRHQGSPLGNLLLVFLLPSLLPYSPEGSFKNPSQVTSLLCPEPSVAPTSLRVEATVLTWPRKPCMTHHLPALTSFFLPTYPDPSHGGLGSVA